MHIRSGGIIVALLAVTYVHVAAQQPQPFTSLFADGLGKWSVQNASASSFSVRDGVLRVEGPAGWLRSDRRYGDFVLRTDVRFMTSDADSGIFVRAADAAAFGRGWPAGSYQVQVRVPSTPSPFPPLGGLFRHGMAQGVTTFDAALVGKLFRGMSEWHALEIELAGDSLIARMDGSEVTRAANILNSPGFIGIQAETGVLEYRQMEIRERP